jgi:hypothetical protein
MGQTELTARGNKHQQQINYDYVRTYGRRESSTHIKPAGVWLRRKSDSQGITVRFRSSLSSTVTLVGIATGTASLLQQNALTNSSLRLIEPGCACCQSKI